VVRRTGCEAGDDERRGELTEAESTPTLTLPKTGVAMKSGETADLT
jgi:hypothetical protein